MSDGKAMGKVLKPRARIMRTLGEELISSETVAVIELVKNSYDADASLVLVKLSSDAGQPSPGGIEVVDNGHGMDLKTVETVFLEPATNSKKKAKFSRKLNRRLLGEKGVGRFASSRLARDLEVFSRLEGSGKEVYAHFDWTQFDDDEKYLDEIRIVAYDRVPEVVKNGWELEEYAQRLGYSVEGIHGTSLKMTGLKRSWSDEEIDALRRGLSRLISPFLNDKSFRILLQGPGECEGHAQEVSPPEIIKYPHYSIRGSFRGGGDFHLDIVIESTAQKVIESGTLRRYIRKNEKKLVDISGASESDFKDGELRPLVCGPFSFEFFAWDRDDLGNVQQKLGVGIRSIRNDLDSVAGINIYRDGFRVLPYGEPDNDWLRLDIRRVNSPKLRLSNNQLVGYIAISADGNPGLKDQSNREGLDESPAFFDFKEVVTYFLSKLEAERRASRKKGEGTDSGHAPGGGSLFDPVDISSLQETLESKFKKDDEVMKLFHESQAAWHEKIGRMKEVVSRYQSLATVGQLVDKVIHNGRQPLATINTQTGLVREAFQRKLKLKDDPVSWSLRDVEKYEGRLSRVVDSAKMLDLLFNRIEPLGGRRAGRPEKLYMEEIIRSSFLHFEEEIKGKGIKVSIPDGKTLVGVDSSEMQEVFINLISNSIYWLDEVPSSRRYISVDIARPREGVLEIIFSDSGPGVKAKDREAIFEPYFSRKHEGGAGLGLIISGEIIRDYYRGSLELLKSGPLPGATFRIILNKRV